MRAHATGMSVAAVLTACVLLASGCGSVSGPSREDTIEEGTIVGKWVEVDPKDPEGLKPDDPKAEFSTPTGAVRTYEFFNDGTVEWTVVSSSDSVLSFDGRYTVSSAQDRPAVTLELEGTGEPAQDYTYEFHQGRLWLVPIGSNDSEYRWWDVFERAE